jgi:hypothetical protein
MDAEDAAAFYAEPSFLLILQEIRHAVFLYVLQILKHAHMVFRTVTAIQLFEPLARIFRAVITEAQRALLHAGAILDFTGFTRQPGCSRPAAGALPGFSLIRHAQPAIHPARRNQLIPHFRHNSLHSAA